MPSEGAATSATTASSTRTKYPLDLSVVDDLAVDAPLAVLLVSRPSATAFSRRLLPRLLDRPLLGEAGYLGRLARHDHAEVERQAEQQQEDDREEGDVGVADAHQVGDDPQQPGEGGARQHPQPGDEPDHAVALLQAVAADQLEDHQHEDEGDDRRQDPRLRGQVDRRVSLGGQRQQRPHYSAPALRGLNWPTSSTIIPLKMKKAERSGVRKEEPPTRSSIRTGTSSTRSPWRTASCSDSISAKSGE